MFYYYGRKKRIAKHYPEPKCDTIIEPFAGAAAYSLHGDNWKKNVILVEKNEKICEIWDWLINTATPEDIWNMPELSPGDKTSNFLQILHAACKRSFGYKTMTVTKILSLNWNRNRKYIANNIHKIKHWQLIQGDYTDAPDIQATWFIDPPYRGDAGTGYGNTGSDSIDYGFLADWVKERQGQVICCEGGDANYLPFEPFLIQSTIGGKKNKEMIYLKDNMTIDIERQDGYAYVSQ